MATVDVYGIKHTDEVFVQAANGDLIGFKNPNGRITYFPAGQADNAITASTASDNSGIQLNYRNSRVTTVGTAGDSVVLPPAKAGMSMTVANNAAANSMDVFPTVGESINALSVNTALAVAANKVVQFTCAVDGLWNSNLTA
jgi:hypothetical protein